MTSLKKTFKVAGLVGAGLVSLSFTGCGGHINEYDALGALFQINAITNRNLSHRQRVLSDVTGRTLSNAGERKHQEEMARIPRRVEVNERRNYQEDERSDEIRVHNEYPMLFTCNAKNKTTITDVGKKIFYAGEEIYLVANVKNILPNETKIKNIIRHLKSGWNEDYVNPFKVGEVEFVATLYDSRKLLKRAGTGKYISKVYFSSPSGWNRLGELEFILLEK